MSTTETPPLEQAKPALEQAKPALEQAKPALESIPEEPLDSDEEEDHGVLGDLPKEHQDKILTDVGDQIEDLVDDIVTDYLNHFLPSESIAADYFAEHHILDNPKAPIRDQMFFWAMNQMARDMQLRDPEAFILHIYGRNAGWKPKQPKKRAANDSEGDSENAEGDSENANDSEGGSEGDSKAENNSILYYMPLNLTDDIQFITGGGETHVIKAKDTLMPFEIVNGNGPYVVAGRTKWTVNDAATGKRKLYMKRSEKEYCCCILWMCWAEDPPYDFMADDYTASDKYTQMMKFTELITGDMLSRLDNLEGEDGQEKSEEIKASEAELRRLTAEMEQLRENNRVKHEDTVIATF